MPKRIPEIELDAIVAVVAAQPKAVPVSVVLGALPAELEIEPEELSGALKLLQSQGELLFIALGEFAGDLGVLVCQRQGFLDALLRQYVE